MAIAGRVAIVPKGDWSADATYKRLDAVTYNNTLYFAKKDVPAGTVTSNTEYWSKSIVGGAGGVATADEAGVVKPADGLTIAEDGTLKVNIDGTTLTMDQVNNVIKLADTLKDAINGAFPAANVANNQITTVEGFALDARQANPNIDGALAKQLSDLNGSLKVHETKTLSIMDSNFATANRCGCYLIQKRWILLTGEIDADFTNTKIYTGYNALRSPVVPFCNTNFIALDEDGIGYIGNFLIDGRIRIEVRSYIPEYKKQILRFSCIAFASI